MDILNIKCVRTYENSAGYLQSEDYLKVTVEVAAESESVAGGFTIHVLLKQTVSMAQSLMGNVNEYDEGEESWEDYTERFDQYAECNKLEGGRKRACFISVMGKKTYALLKGLVAPEKPNTKSYQELVELLSNHLAPEPIVIAERFKFYRREQQDGETVAQFLCELRKFAEKCKFGAFLEEVLRDIFVCGLRSTAIQKKLLSEKDLDLKKALNIAQGHEAADMQSAQMKPQTSKSPASVAMVSEECWRCGKSTHTSDQCYYKTAKCHKCKHVGHLSRRCEFVKSPRKSYTLSAPAEKPKFKPKKKMRARVKRVEEVGEEEYEDSEVEEEPVCDVPPTHSVNSDSKWPTFHIHSPDRDEIYVDMRVNGVDVSMELDTGSAKTVISENMCRQLGISKQSLQPCSGRLVTYLKEQVPTLGWTVVEVSLDGAVRRLPLVVCKGNVPALFGRNWIWEYNLLGDLKLKIAKLSHDGESLWTKYESLFDGGLGTVKGVTASLKLKLDAKPKFYKPRPVPYALKDKVSDELQRLEKMGVLEKVEFSDWATPIVPVLKPDGSVRVCGDYKVTLNPQLEVPEYPMPTAEDLFATLNGGEKFTKLDLSTAYQQVLLDDESRNLTCISTHLGLFRYTRLPYGVASAPAIFQQIMDTTLQGLPSVGCILDDMIVTGSDDPEHYQNVDQALDRLQTKGMKLKRSKCAIMQDKVEYFSFIVDKEGIHASPEKVRSILEAPAPTSVKELQSLMGAANYYRKFIPDMSTICAPLNALLVKDRPWVWCDQCEQAFLEIKEILASPTVLAHYDPKLPLRLEVEASPAGVGAVLTQVMSDGNRPIAYASRSLTSAEKNYSQLEREGLAIIFGLEKYHQYLYGRKFKLVTDNQPLALILGPKKGIPALATARLQRWAIKLSAYQYDMEYRSSEQNANADMLSRLPIPGPPEEVQGLFCVSEVHEVHRVQLENLPVSPSQIRAATLHDPVLSRVVHFVVNGWPSVCELSPELKVYHKNKDEYTLEDGCILRGIRVVIPAKLQARVLGELHASHPGIVRMKSLARLHVWWASLDQDIEETVRGCTKCQVSQSAPAPSINPWVWPLQAWQRIHVDFCGPFENSMFLIVVDAHSKWIEVLRMTSTTAESTINALRFLFAAHGLPEELVSDNGPQFVAWEFREFMKQQWS